MNRHHWSVAVAVGFFALICGRAHAQWVPNGIAVGSSGQSHQNQDVPRVVPDGDGGAFVSWGEQRSSDTGFDGYLQHVFPNGTLDPRWPTSGFAYVAAMGTQSLSAMAADGLGGVLLFWMDYRNSTDEIYAARVGADGQLAPGWPKDGVPIRTGVSERFIWDVCPDGAGGGYFAWHEAIGGVDQARLTRYNGDGTLAAGWPSEGRALTSYTGVSSAEVLLPAPDGCLVVWVDGRGGTTLGDNLWALRFTGTGNVYPGWNPDGVPLLTIGTGVAIRHVVSDGAGGAFMAWNDNRTGVVPINPYYFDLYAQHVLADGTRDARWPINGLPVCTAPDYQYDFDMAADGVGGCLLMWEDDRAGFVQMYGQRLRADGSVAQGWIPDGTPVSNSPIWKAGPHIAADGLGGFYGVWQAYPAVGFDLVGGQHMRGDGSFDPAWGAAGLQVAYKPTGECLEPWLCPDGQGGAYLAYQQSDPAPWTRIYALRIQNDGPVPTLLSLADYDAGPGVVTLRWQGSDATSVQATVERSTEGGTWTALGAPRLEGTDLLVYEDRAVSPGRYSYRLAYMEGSAARWTDPVIVGVPAAAQLALGGFQPNPAIGNSTVAFSLPDAKPSRLEVVDIRGRVVFSREVGVLGAGSHSLPLSEAGRLGPGVYWVRLIRPEGTLTRKGVVAG